MSAHEDDKPDPLFGVQLRAHELAGAIEAAQQHAIEAERSGRPVLARCRHARVAALIDCQRLATANLARRRP